MDRNRAQCIAVTLIATFVATAAGAQQHSLTAQASGPFVGQGESTTDINDDEVEWVQELGVAGVNPSYYHYEARANGATGSLHLLSVFSLEGGFEDPIQPVPNNIRPLSSIDEWVTPNGSGRVRATLVVEPWALIQDNTGSGPANAQYEATLALGDCRVTVTHIATETVFETNDVVADCPEYFDATASGSGQLLVVTWNSVDSGDEIQLSAHVRYELSYFQYADLAQIGYDASLHLEGDATTTLSYPSPGFQTQAPEPDASLLGVAALGALAWMRRRGRS